MSGGVGRSIWVPVLLIVTLGYVVWSETNDSVLAVFAGAEAAVASSSASKASLCEKLPGWCEKQAYSTSDRPRNKIQDKMAETRWRKKKESGGLGGYLSPFAKSERVKPKIEDKLWFRGGVAPRPSRHSEDWKSRLKSELFSEEDEDAWEVDDEEDYIKVEDESDEEEEEVTEEESVEETEEDEESEEDEEEEEEEEEFEEEEELETEEEFEEGDEDVSEIAGIFKKRWGFDEEEEGDDSEEVIRKAKQEEKKKIEEEAKRKKSMLEQIKRDAELKKKALEEEKRRKINENRKKKIEDERRKKKEEEGRKQAEEESKKEEEAERKELEEQRRKEEEENRRRINEERRKRLELEKERKEEEDRQRRDEEEQKKEEKERQKREKEERERKEEEEKRKEAERQREIEEEKEEKRRMEEERIRLEKQEAKKKLDTEKRKKEQEEAEKKRAEEEKRKKEEARKESDRIKQEENKRKRELADKKRKEEEKHREEEERRKEEEKARKDKEKKREEERKIKEEVEEKERIEEEKNKKEEGKKKKEEGKKKDVLVKKEKEVSEQKEKIKEKTRKDKNVTLEEEADETPAKTSKSKTKSKRKAEKISTSEWSPDFPEFFAPTANDEVQNEKCKKQSRIYVQHLRRMRSWALQMYDATAKLPSGILSGNVNQFGDFDECLAVDVNLRARGSDATPSTSPAPLPLVESSSVGGLADFLQRVLSWGAALVKVARGASGSEVVNIRGRYCLASIDVDVLSDPRRSRADNAALHDAVQRALSYRFLRGSINDTQHFVPRFSTVSWALCVPAACSARDVQDGLLASIRNWEQGEDSWGRGKVRFQLSIPEDACRIAPQQPPHKRLPPSFYFVIGGLALLVMLALVATLKDHGEADEDMVPERRVLIAFSLRRSWAVLSAPDDIGSADIHCMHGLRAVCSLALYMAHKVIPAASAPYSNRGKLTQAALSPLSLVLRSSVVYTDTFLLLSGALSSFHFSKELARTGRLAWRDRYVARLFRLTPPLIAVLLYYSFVMEHIGDGPRWGPLVEANARLCRKNMWRNLLYIQNFYPFKEMCAPQTHQLALDVQLSLLSAPLVWLLHYSPLLASPILLVLQAASAWLRHRTALQHRVALLIYHGQKASELYRAADLSYALAPHRATAYMVGIALGYALHVIQKPLKMPKVMVIVGWISSVALAGWAIFGLRGAATKDFKFDARQVATFNAFAPLAWAVAISWVILACHADLGGIVGRILCSRVLLLLSRISYAFYLTQFIVFFHNAGSARSQTEFSIFGVLDLWEFITVLAVSTIFTLLIDLPVQAVRAALAHKTEPKEKNNAGTGTRVRRSKQWDRNNELTWRNREE